MAAVTWADVTGIAAQLTTVALATQTAILAHVNTAHAVTMFGGEDAPRLRLARIYLAAHLATVGSSGSGLAGPVTSESAGNISRSYAVVASDSSLWGTTSYGQLYAMLVQTSLARLPRAL